MGVPAGDVPFPGLPLAGKRAGVIIGELKQRRYKAMKKSSLAAQAINRTVCPFTSVSGNRVVKHEMHLVRVV